MLRTVKRELTFRIVLLEPPAGVDFGLQMGRGSINITVQKQRSRGKDLRFQFPISVAAANKGALPDFRGPGVSQASLLVNSSLILVPGVGLVLLDHPWKPQVIDSTKRQKRKKYRKHRVWAQIGHMNNHQEKRVGVYLRVSTRDGKQDTENQRLQLRQLIDSMGWQPICEYEDHESGAKAQRNGFQAMMRDAAQRKFDLVLFWALDRFSREGTLQTLKHLEVLESYGVRWRSLTEPWIDSAGPFRDVVIALIASLAKQERVRLSQRVRAGLERARKEGTRSGREIGRPRVIFDREAVVRLRSQGLSWSQVAVQVGASVGTVRRTYEVLRSSV